jgi:hypothetical protein
MYIHVRMLGHHAERSPRKSRNWSLRGEFVRNADYFAVCGNAGQLPVEGCELASRTSSQGERNASVDRGTALELRVDGKVSPH